jgi:hypothetical protein
MNETPRRQVVTNRGASPDTKYGSAAAIATPQEPTSMGFRTPIRSVSRPAVTASSIGRNA